jgi:hypothetical protein
VKPTRSAKSTVTSRRSATGASRVALAGAGSRAAESGDPQSPQKRFSGGFSAPHVAQTTASAVPQSPQKRFPAGFSAPQFGQITPSNLEIHSGFFASP